MRLRYVEKSVGINVDVHSSHREVRFRVLIPWFGCYLKVGLQYSPGSSRAPPGSDVFGSVDGPAA